MKPFAYAMPFLILVPIVASPSLANDSTYTDLDTDRCKPLLPEDTEGGSLSLRCKGFKDHAVYFKEGDLRQSILYGPVSDTYIAGVFESFEPFNNATRKIEWRLDADGKPVATILRWFLDNIDPVTYQPSPKLKGQVLVVSKVADGTGQGCVVGYVDALANPDPNALARQVADARATNFVCGKDMAGYHGIRGPTAAEPTHVFPD
ncbi:hypothetical protein [Pararhizobium sp. DWP1-1-3]|uniref:hypothetical protein n=1 Tax=Pararhizobium sp. DWP1-1-3 TaxID=2804652 RepID=UPI003CF2FF58